MAGRTLALTALLWMLTACRQEQLSLPVTQRISDMVIRLSAVREELAAPIFHGSPQARDLGIQIEEFGRAAVTSGLHSLTG